MGARGDAGAPSPEALPAVHELAAALDAPHALAVAAAAARDRASTGQRWLAGRAGADAGGAGRPAWPGRGSCSTSSSARRCGG